MHCGEALDQGEEAHHEVADTEGQLSLVSFLGVRSWGHTSRASMSLDQGQGAPAVGASWDVCRHATETLERGSSRHVTFLWVPAAMSEIFLDVVGGHIGRVPLQDPSEVGPSLFSWGGQVANPMEDHAKESHGSLLMSLVRVCLHNDQSMVSCDVALILGRD